MVKKSKKLVIQLKYPRSQSSAASLVGLNHQGEGSCISEAGASVGMHTLHSSWRSDTGHGTAEGEGPSIPPLPWACHDAVPQHKHSPPTLSLGISCVFEAIHLAHVENKALVVRHVSHHTASTKHLSIPCK